MNKNNILEGEVLCKECGLCCQGVFHKIAYLYNKNDIYIAKKENLLAKYDTKSKKNYFPLPCPVFNGLCSIYPERPSVCSEHKCDLLNDVINEESTLEDALRVVVKMKSILTNLLPDLHKHAQNNQIHNPKVLMESIQVHLKDNQSKEDFKKNHKKILIDFGVFCFLAERHFYLDLHSESEL